MFVFKIVFETTNFTSPLTLEVETVNISRVIATPTTLRLNIDYIRDYTLISATVLTVLIPMIIMIIW